MDKQLIEDALNSALSLINNEAESLESEDLMYEYSIVSNKLENALRELNGNE